MLGAALLLCSVATGTLGVAVGRGTAASRTTSHVSVVGPGTPRAAVVLAAHEAITEAPSTAPAKLALLASAPRVLRSAAAPAPSHRPGFQRPANLAPVAALTHRWPGGPLLGFSRGHGSPLSPLPRSR